MTDSDTSLEKPDTSLEKTVARPLPRIVSYSKVRVSVIQGPDKGQSRDLVSDTLNVGSSSDNELPLTDNTVSRRHCSISPIAAGVRIRDEDSTNGVFIAGMRLYDAVITSTVQVNLGSTVLQIEPLSEVVSREQAVTERFGDLLGRSARMRELFADLARIAPSEVTVLVEGETGTGKELVAESLHQASTRSEQPFVVFDCSAVAPTLVETELFGHERGAFTGAVSARAGLFEQAHGGTIFLDELGELPKDIQPKLLRVLERRQVRRLGSQHTVNVDVRLIAATNRNLFSEVQRGNFREDLYFRLSTTQVRIPPLRDRMDDLPLLVEHFLGRVGSKTQVADIPAAVWAMFKNHRWPGNVRELWNAVQRFTVTPDKVLPDHSPADRAATAAARPDGPPQPLRIARRDAGDAFERAYLEHILSHTSGNVVRAAAVAEVSRQMIQKMMRKHSL